MLFVALTAVAGKLSAEAESVAAGLEATAVPLSVTVCGELMALSEKVSAAESVPAAAGLKVTEMEQEPPAASEVEQVLLLENEEGFDPARETLERVSGVEPVFLRVTV